MAGEADLEGDFVRRCDSVHDRKNGKSAQCPILEKGALFTDSARFLGG